MKIIRLDPKRPDPKILREAAAILKRGGLVVYPTETAYALGGDARDTSVIRRIFSVKARDLKKPLPVIAASAAMVRRFARLDPMNAALARAFWPGPLTLVLPSSRPEGLAVRVSPHPVARELSRLLGGPIVSTSANRSGGTTPYSAKGVLTELGTMPELLLDAGELTKREPSTIVRADECCAEILRAGPISAQKILNVLRACA